MYHFIVKQVTRKAFENVSSGNFDAVIQGCAPHIRHTFRGEHALGGERNDVQSFRWWLERVARLSPQFTFELHDIFVSGTPWNTRVMVRWTKHDTQPDGQVISSWGNHYIVLKWFRTVSIDVYPDTAGTIAEMQQLAVAGVAEAVAEPITS
ncbi:MAG: nuclear transport factor 2 family protein [Chloroflexota bacterium]